MEASPLQHLHALAAAQSKVLIINRSRKEIKGILHSVDKHFNVLLSCAEETRVQGPVSTKGKKRKVAQVFTRSLGNLFIRGDSIISISYEE